LGGHIFVSAQLATVLIAFVITVVILVVVGGLSEQASFCGGE
jgi:hypothetical protein